MVFILLVLTSQLKASLPALWPSGLSNLAAHRLISHFTEKKMEAHEGEATFPELQSWKRSSERGFPIPRFSLTGLSTIPATKRATPAAFQGFLGFL